MTQWSPSDASFFLKHLQVTFENFERADEHFEHSFGIRRGMADGSQLFDPKPLPRNEPLRFALSIRPKRHARRGHDKRDQADERQNEHCEDQHFSAPSACRAT
jgi:hypothetical protein